MKKMLALILAAVLVIALLGLYGCHPAAPEATEPTAATDVTETTAVTEATTATETTVAVTETPETTGSTAPAETEAPTAPAEVNRPQGGSTGNNNGHQTGNTGTGAPAVTQPPVTEAPAVPSTEPAAPVAPTVPSTEAPTEHTHNYTVSSTTPATCTGEGSTTYICACGDSYTEPIPMTDHNWVHHHEDEVGHQEGGCMCDCGAIFSTTAEWIAHTKSFDPKEAFLNHGGNGSYSWWVVDTPAKDWDECSICGAIK